MLIKMRQSLTAGVKCPTLYTHKLENSVGGKKQGTTLIINQHYLPILVVLIYLSKFVMA